MPGRLAGLARDLADLVLPAGCAGCPGRAGRGGLCPSCRGALAAARPAPVPAAPRPDAGPPCVALAAYAGALRSALLAYKERGRHPLAAPLGDALAGVVAAGALAAGLDRTVPVLLVAVPATAAARRRRGGDHALRLARRAARRLRRAGWSVGVARPLRARPRPDSAGLSAAERARTAVGAFVPRPRRLPALRRAAAAGVAVVLVDDVVTTGSTLAAAAGALRAGGVPVALAAVLAATPRRVRPNTQDHITRRGGGVPANEW